MTSDVTLRAGTIDQGLRAGLDDMLQLNWEEVEIEHQRVPLAINWPAYRALERSGILKPFYLWRGRELIGYSVWFVQPVLHHMTTPWAVNDLVYLEPEERRGRVGVYLIRQAEALLRGLGVKVISYNVKPAFTNRRTTVGMLLSKLGYTLVEEAYAKYL